MGRILAEIKKLTAILSCTVACWIDCHSLGNVLCNKLEHTAMDAEVPIIFWRSDDYDPFRHALSMACHSSLED